jgi:hypothetical protein
VGCAEAVRDDIIKNACNKQFFMGFHIEIKTRINLYILLHDCTAKPTTVFPDAGREF